MFIVLSQANPALQSPTTGESSPFCRAHMLWICVSLSPVSTLLHQLFCMFSYKKQSPWSWMASELSHTSGWGCQGLYDRMVGAQVVPRCKSWSGYSFSCEHPRWMMLPSFPTITINHFMQCKSCLGHCSPFLFPPEHSILSKGFWHFFYVGIITLCNTCMGQVCRRGGLCDLGWFPQTFPRPWLGSPKPFPAHWWHVTDRLGESPSLPSLLSA